MGGSSRAVPQNTATWHIAMLAEEPSTASKAVARHRRLRMDPRVVSSDRSIPTHQRYADAVDRGPRAGGRRQRV